MIRHDADGYPYVTASAGETIPIFDQERVDMPASEYDALRARLASLEAEREAVAPLVEAALAYHMACVEARAMWDRTDQSYPGDEDMQAAWQLQGATYARLRDATGAYAARAGQGGEGA